MGEDVIRDLETALRTAAPAGAEVFRTGDDEVTLIADAALMDGDRLATLYDPLRAVATLPDERLELPLVVGCSGQLGPNDDPDVAYRRAVAAAVSADGRRDSGIVFATDELEAEAHDFATLAALRRAVENGEIEVWYQPQLRISDARVAAAEALVRWRRSDGTLMSPLDFLPLAERDGCIVDVGRAVIEQALAASGRFRAAGLERMSINASVRELVAPGYVQYLVDALRRHRLPASFIEIELVETAELGPVVATVLADLHAAGIRVAVDDYGTGWSSMAYLVQFRFDTLKIDRLFVRDMSVDDRARSLVEATISMASVLGVRVVAEGVEDEQQARIVRDAGCDILQGYAISQPVPADRFEQFLHGWQWVPLTPQPA
jgi:EAL domain-containing protein (putative c-di-GMP-specific phosphodiesterase class I)